MQRESMAGGTRGDVPIVTRGKLARTTDRESNLASKAKGRMGKIQLFPVPEYTSKPVSDPQLFASNTLTVTNTSDFSDDLFLTKNWAGNSGPELRLLGNRAPVRAGADGSTHCPCCLVIAGNTGSVVYNATFTNLSDSRVKTEMAEADLGELLQLFDSVEAKQYKRPNMNGDLRLGFASDDSQ